MFAQYVQFYINFELFPWVEPKKACDVYMMCMKEYEFWKKINEKLVDPII